MTNEQIGTLATIVNRFEAQREACKKAANAITEAQQLIFSENLDMVDRINFRLFIEKLQKIADNSTQSDAVKYFNNLEKLQ